MANNNNNDFFYCKIINEYLKNNIIVILLFYIRTVILCYNIYGCLNFFFFKRQTNAKYAAHMLIKLNCRFSENVTEMWHTVTTNQEDLMYRKIHKHTFEAK